MHTAYDDMDTATTATEEADDTAMVDAMLQQDDVGNGGRQAYEDLEYLFEDDMDMDGVQGHSGKLTNRIGYAYMTGRRLLRW